MMRDTVSPMINKKPDHIVGNYESVSAASSHQLKYNITFSFVALI